MGAKLITRGIDKRVHTIRDRTPLRTRTFVPKASKLPLTAKSVAVLFFFCSIYERPTWWAAAGSMGCQDQDPIARSGRHGRAFWTVFGDDGTGRRAAGVRATRTHSLVPLLIELIFCLGSKWAKLELAFLASVKFIIHRIQCLSPLRCFVLAMDQMNFTHLYKYHVHPPGFHPIEPPGTENYLSKMNDPRSLLAQCPYMTFAEIADYICLRRMNLAPRPRRLDEGAPPRRVGLRVFPPIQ